MISDEELERNFHTMHFFMSTSTKTFSIKLHFTFLPFHSFNPRDFQLKVWLLLKVRKNAVTITIAVIYKKVFPCTITMLIELNFSSRNLCLDFLAHYYYIYLSDYYLYNVDEVKHSFIHSARIKLQTIFGMEFYYSRFATNSFSLLAWIKKKKFRLHICLHVFFPIFLFRS